MDKADDADNSDTEIGYDNGNSKFDEASQDSDPLKFRQQRT